MKKSILFAVIMLAVTSVQEIKAQEVYDYLLDKAELVINDPNSKDFDLKVAQFKFTAMRYFRKNIILQ
jgi:hypothetical protein